MKNDSKTKEGHLIFRPYVIRNGKFVYPKEGKVLAFLAKD